MLSPSVSQGKKYPKTQTRADVGKKVTREGRRLYPGLKVPITVFSLSLFIKDERE